MQHREWIDLSRTEYDRILRLLQQLAPGDWGKPTDCPEWDLRQLVAHLLGAAEAAASFREGRRQQRLGKAYADRPQAVDRMTAVQVAERADHSADRLLRNLADAAPRALRGRAAVPAPLRRLRLPMDPPLRWARLGYLVDVVLTRDLWMHRIDLARATSAELELSAEHDGRIVADIVADWARRHRQPYELELTGPAGGVYRNGSGGQRHRLDAVDFARVLSGRGAGEGLLATPTVVF